MDRVVISKNVLDRLIRAKLEQIEDCSGVLPLPVVVRGCGSGRGCNWMIPGWTGEEEFVNRCNRRMKAYLEFLRGQFNIGET